MYKIISVTDLDDFQYRLSCGVELVEATQTAMAEGSTERNYSDAIFGVVLYLRSLSDELRKMVDDACSQKDEKLKEGAEA